MARAETYREDWVAIGCDEDGTEAFLDEGAVVRDLETSLFTAWIKHVPLPGSRTYEELQHAFSGARKQGIAPHHVKQLVEIDLEKGLSRTLNLVVCDKQGSVLDTISFRFPDWSEIQEESIIGMAGRSVAARFLDERKPEYREEALKFSAPSVHPKPDRIQVAKPFRAQPTTPVGELKLQQVDV